MEEEAVLVCEVCLQEVAEDPERAEVAVCSGYLMVLVAEQVHCCDNLASDLLPVKVMV